MSHLISICSVASHLCPSPVQPRGPPLLHVALEDARGPLGQVRFAAPLEGRLEATALVDFRPLAVDATRCLLSPILLPKESCGLSQLLHSMPCSNSEIWSCVAYTFLSQSAHVCAIEHIQQRLIEKPAVYSIFVSYCLQCFCLRPNDLFRYIVASLPHVPGTEGARRKSWAPSNCRRRGTFDEKHEGSFTECSG